MSEQSARERAELILGSLWNIPDDPELYSVEIQDYEKDEVVVVELPRPKGGGRGWGGREGAKRFADSLFSTSKKGKRGEAALKTLLKKIDKGIAVVERAAEGGGGEEAEAEEVVKGRVKKACSGLVKVEWGGAGGDDEADAQKGKRKVRRRA